MSNIQEESEWEPELSEQDQIKQLDEFLLHCVRNNRMPSIEYVFPGFTSKQFAEFWQKQHGTTPEWLQEFIKRGE